MLGKHQLDHFLLVRWLALPAQDALAEAAARESQHQRAQQVVAEDRLRRRADRLTKEAHSIGLAVLGSFIKLAMLSVCVVPRASSAYAPA